MSAYHIYSSGAKTKGWIKNNKTGRKMSFQFNPTEFAYSRGATYNEIIAPGMPYPLTQYGHGNAREFSVTLFMYDNPCSGKISNAEHFLEDFLPDEGNGRKNFKKPIDLTICVGKFVKKCVLTDLGMNIQRIDTNGYAIQAEISLSLRQI